MSVVSAQGVPAAVDAVSLADADEIVVEREGVFIAAAPVVLQLTVALLLERRFYRIFRGCVIEVPRFVVVERKGGGRIFAGGRIGALCASDLPYIPHRRRFQPLLFPFFFRSSMIFLITFFCSSSGIFDRRKSESCSVTLPAYTANSSSTSLRFSVHGNWGKLRSRAE